MEGVSADGAFGYDGASVAAVTWPEGHARSRNRGRPAGVCTRHFGPGLYRESFVQQCGSVQYRPSSKVGVGFPSATTLDALTAGSVIVLPFLRFEHDIPALQPPARQLPPEPRTRNEQGSAEDHTDDRVDSRILSTPRSGAAATHRRGTLPRVSGDGLTSSKGS